MILYNVWFSFKAGVDETVELEKVKAFLDDLKNRARIHHYRLLKNRAEKGKSTLPPYQVIAEFSDGTPFDPPSRKSRKSAFIPANMAP